MSKPEAEQAAARKRETEQASARMRKARDLLDAISLAEGEFDEISEEITKMGQRQEVLREQIANNRRQIIALAGESDS